MLTAGKTISNNISNLFRKHTEGFTLIELTIVIFIAGLLLSITVPVVRDTLLHDDLKTVSRKLVATITWLRNKSISEYNNNVLMFDIDTPGKYWHESSEMTETELLQVREQANILPEDVRILDIDLYGKGKKVDGEIGISFSNKGYINYSLIHLSDKNDRKFTLVVEPFTGKVKIMEEYLNFEDLLSRDI